MRGAGTLAVVCALAAAHSLVAARALAQDPGAGEAPADPVHAAVRGDTPPLAVAEAREDIPAGEIRVLVVDPDGAPIPGAVVELGVLAQMGKREKRAATTGPDGRATFSGLATGSAQAYRVNVPFEGATTSSNPFQLPPRVGYDVTVTRLPVSDDARFVLQFLFRVYLELKDGRVRVVEQTTLANLGRATYVFPKDGLEVELPEGRLAFQTQAGMGDQRLVESEKGFQIFGSVPPGRTQLLWAFDLPIDGTEVRFRQPLAFRTYRFSIESDAPPGVKLEVVGLPPAITREEKGNRFLVTQEQFDPGAAGLDALDVRLSGLPGPGPVRWIALGLAAAFMLVGGALLRRPRAPVDGTWSTRLAEARALILADAEALEEEFLRGDVGPKYRDARLEVLTERLALVLRAERTASRQDRG